MERKRIAIEAYKDGSGWFAHFPSNGRIGIIKATAETAEELEAWCKKHGFIPTVIR